ncbi:hypothetical protein DFS33DRAFT_1277006 [Desarmillaria ectypa]|nr:hypothetical protein DFS33DRAFT_1277006 [Desarmillaria ectypa]
MSFLFPLQCWTLLSLLFPTAMAYIIHLENNCGSGSDRVVLEEKIARQSASTSLDGPLTVWHQQPALILPSHRTSHCNLLPLHPRIRRPTRSSKIPASGLPPGFRDAADSNCHRIDLRVARSSASLHNDLYVAEQGP